MGSFLLSAHTQKDEWKTQDTPSRILKDTMKTPIDMQNMTAGAKSLLGASVELIQSEEWQAMVGEAGKACAKFYLTLIENGVPESAAGMITASYATALSKMNGT